MLPSTTGSTSSEPEQARRLIRHNAWSGPTVGVAPGYAQANVIILPAAHALEFVRFCLLNWAACPILEILAPGTWTPITTAPSADIRTDVPRYLVHREGRLVDEVSDITALWRPDLVAVLLGCSFTVDGALLAAGVPVRHIELNHADPTFVTDRPCRRTENMGTNLLVSMRPIPRDLVERTTEVTSRYVRAHGGPLWLPTMADGGSLNLARPDHGQAIELGPDEVPMFWACGLTAVAAALSASPPLVLSHKPAHMFITDLPDEELTRMDTDVPYEAGAQGAARGYR